MRNNDTGPLILLHDVKSAFGLLTRLPFHIDTERATRRGAAAAWAYPLVGLGVGFFASLLAVVFLAMGVPATIVAALALGLMIILTGAMHEDGLATAISALTV